MGGEYAHAHGGSFVPSHREVSVPQDVLEPCIFKLAAVAPGVRAAQSGVDELRDRPAPVCSNPHAHQESHMSNQNAPSEYSVDSVRSRRPSPPASNEQRQRLCATAHRSISGGAALRCAIQPALSLARPLPASARTQLRLRVLRATKGELRAPTGVLSESTRAAPGFRPATTPPAARNRRPPCWVACAVRV